MRARTRSWLVLAAAALLLAPGAAWAEEDLDDVEPAKLPAQPGEPAADAAPATTPEDDAAGAPGEPGGKHKGKDKHKDQGKSEGAADPGKDKDKDNDALQVGGRVFARATAFDTDSTAWASELALQSVRIGVSYRWKDRLRIKAVLEAAGKVSLRDAFVELPAGDGLQLRAGRFKGAVSAIERASAWELPTIGRGAVADILDDGVGLTGRRDGVELSWAPGASKDPRWRVLAVLSQSVATTGDSPARPLSDGGGVAAAVRAELRPRRGVTLGAVASNREVNYVADVGRYWAGGLDAEVDLDDAGLGLRLWADVLVGQSHLAAPSADSPTTFVAGQLIAGWRLGGAKKGKRYLEPFALAGYLNPDTGHRLDHVLDLGVGLAGGRWKRWRAQLQLSNLGTWSRRPAGLGGFNADVDDRLSLSVQLGAAF